MHTVNDNSKASLLRRDPTLIGAKMDQSKEDRGNDEGNRPKVMLRKTGAATTGIVFDNFTFVISGNCPVDNRRKFFCFQFIKGFQA